MSNDQTPVSDPEPSLLTRDQFAEAVATKRRRIAWVALTLGVGFLLLMSILSVATVKMNETGVPLASPWRYVLIGSLIPFVFVTIWLINRMENHHPVICPHCGDPLDQSTTPYFAVVTGRCPHCAASLFEHDQARQPQIRKLHSTALLSRTEFETAKKLARRAALRPALAWAVSGVVLIVIGRALAPWLLNALAPRLDKTWTTPFITGLMVFPGFAVALWALAVWSRHCHVSRPCPHCGGEITPNSCATLTGNCPACGLPAVSDPFPGIEPIPDRQPTPQWSTPEFHDLAKRRHDHLWIGCFLGAGLAIIWITPFLLTLSSHGHVTSANMLPFAVCYGGTILVQFAGMVWWHRHSARDICCPECRKELLHFFAFVVSSRRCYHCGATVIKPPHDPPTQTM